MIAILLGANAIDTSVASAQSLASAPQAPDKLSVAVRYGGGKARMPMLEREAHEGGAVAKGCPADQSAPLQTPANLPEGV
jgi:hypothetical protein